MRRMLAVLLAVGLLAGCAAAEGTPVELRVGNPTPMRGEFFTELWGNSTSDDDVRALLHGYDLVHWKDADGQFGVNPTVVRAFAAMENAAGDRTYVIVLHDDLRYSDGSPVTAWDYAFTWLLELSPEVRAIGGRPLHGDQFAGSAAYAAGEAKELAGVRVTAERTMTVTVRHEALPFFYELGLLMCTPSPVSVIAPGVRVKDDGNGVYLANEDESAAEPVYTAELLRKTLLDPESGYLYHPAPVTGPYTLAAWDGTTAEFEINPFYKGNAEGKKPTIRRLRYTTAENADAADRLADGTFGLLNKVTEKDAIEAGLRLRDAGLAAVSSYPRTGLSYIGFACERKTVAEKAVRQAIAWCLDRDALTAEYTGSYGTRVDGYFGIGQWMYRLITGAVKPPVREPEEGDEAAKAAYEEALAAYDALSLDGLTRYTADTARARALLDGDGWTLNAAGVREKELDGETVTLDLTMVYPEGNDIPVWLEKEFVPKLAEAGIRLEMKPLPMADLLTGWYRQAERDADLIYMGSNFDPVFDPAAHLAAGEEHAPGWNFTGWEDESLYALADDMRHTQPGDVIGYMRKWIAFQERLNEQLPLLPLYGNLYFDFYTPVLYDYDIAGYPTWGDTIVEARLADGP